MEIDHKTLEKSIRKTYETGISLFVSGTTGIGKSETLLKVGRDLAVEEKRTFVEWTKLSDTEKRKLYNDQKVRRNTFLFADVRISQMDPSDLRGLPMMNGADFVEWKPSLLFKVLSLPDIKGILFFDEMNLAPPSVQASAYQIVLDKAIGEIAINPDICIIAAGNRLEDKANVYEMAGPLKNRFRHVTLSVPSHEQWVDWGYRNGVDTRIITYIQFKPTQLMGNVQDTSNGNSFASPRSWKFASDMIKGEDSLSDVQQYVSECVGDGVGIEFKAFIRLRDKIDLENIFKHPKKAIELPTDLKWSLIGLVAEKYKANKKILTKAITICNKLDPEFGVSLMRMLQSTNPKHFEKEALDCKEGDKFVELYGQFLC